MRLIKLMSKILTTYRLSDLQNQNVKLGECRIMPAKSNYKMIMRTHQYGSITTSIVEIYNYFTTCTAPLNIHLQAKNCTTDCYLQFYDADVDILVQKNIVIKKH